MKDVERVNALNKMLLNANVVAYGAMVDLIKRTGRLDLDMDSGTHVDDFPAEIRIFTDNGLICLSITSVYLSGEDNLMAELPSEALYFPDIFDDDKVLDGISIKSDYIGKVFHLIQQTEMRNDDILNNINNLSLYMNGASRSSGEKNLHAMNSLFDFVFNQDEYAFPIQKLMEFKKKSNEFWTNRIDNLLKYYKDNHVVLMEKDFEYTILMDEPDRNLDVDNIMDLYNVLSFHKPQTQIIAVIHNPALIYKLSKLDCVNFIEMTKGYLKKITSFMNKK